MVFTVHNSAAQGNELKKLITTDTVNSSQTISQLLKSAKQKTLKNFDGALVDANQALNLSIYKQNKPSVFQSYRRIGNIYEENSRYKEARLYYEKAISLSKTINNDSSKLDIYVDWAIINKKTGNYKIAQDFYNATLELAEKTKDIEMIEFAHDGLGSLYALVGDYEKAVHAFHQSIKVAEQRQNKQGVIKSLRNLSDMYLKAQNYELATINIKQAYGMALEIKDTSRISSALNIHGQILSAQRQFQEALPKHEQALGMFEKRGDKKKIVQTLILIADVYTSLKNYKVAESYFIRCIPFKDFIEYNELPNFYYKLGKLYQKQNQNEKAIQSLEKSIELASQKGFKDVLQKANLSLSQSFNKKQDYRSAYTYLEKANSYGDSLFTEEKTSKLAEAQFKFDVERGEKEIQALKVKQGFSMLVIAVCVIVFLIGVFIYILKLKNKNTLVLLQKNQEIILQNTRLEKSNEILRQFAYASAHDLKEPLRSISSFVHIIHRRYMKLLPPEAEEYMNFVIGGVKRMEQLLSALLEYSTVASDDHVVTNATLLTKVLNDVKENLHTTIQEKKAVINTEGYLPIVWVSQLHLTQLFQNLISNSMKFSNRPPIINIKGEVIDNQLVINIQDNGIGMKKEYSDKIFRLFQRLSRSSQYEGTGIGLAICKHIVDKYNGTIWFDSVEGEGTTFHISFPLNLIKQERDTEGVDHDVKKDMLVLRAVKS